MARRFTHYTETEQFYISKRLIAGDALRKISEDLGRDAGSLSREISRNKDQITGLYSGIVAHEKAKLRQSLAVRKPLRMSTISKDTSTAINEHLIKRSSPEQISKELKEKNLDPVSHPTIYAHIKRNRSNGGALYLHLRHKGRKRKATERNKDTTKGSNKNSINIRPKKILLLLTLGNWEIDTIFGKDQKSFLLTMVEIGSKYTIIRKLPNKKATTVENAIDEIIQETGIPVKTITSDNGSEFANHESIAKKHNLKWYFCHPYCSGERGLNENTNGLIRDFLEKGTDFNKVSDDRILYIQNNLNDRMRKTLGFSRPINVFMNKFIHHRLPFDVILQ